MRSSGEVWWTRERDAVKASSAQQQGQVLLFFFFQAEDGIRDYKVTGVKTCALPISSAHAARRSADQLLLCCRAWRHTDRNRRTSRFKTGRITYPVAETNTPSLSWKEIGRASCRERV